MEFIRKKKGNVVSTRLTNDVFIKLKEICLKKDAQISQVIECAVNLFIEKFHEKPIDVIESSNKIQRASIDPMRLVELWNEHCIPKGYKRCHGLGAGIHLKNFLESLKYLPTEKDWTDLFDTMFKSKFLKGENDKGWRPGLTWIVNFDNAIKVKNGDFSDNNGLNREEFWNQMKIKYEG